jgi:hypothetical protein
VVAFQGQIEGFVVVVVHQVVEVLRNSFYRMYYLPRNPIVVHLDRRRKIFLPHTQLVEHRIQNLRTPDRRTYPYVDCSTPGIRRSVVDTSGLRSTGVSSRGSCWDYTVDDGVVESGLKVWVWVQYLLMQRGWNHRTDLAWFAYRH